METRIENLELEVKELKSVVLELIKTLNEKSNREEVLEIARRYK